MVIFDSRDAGTPASAWADPRLTLAPPLDVAACSELLVFAAHPDDETLGAGGLIHDFASRGLPVTVVVVTDGAASGELGIAVRRSGELAEAVALLAPSARVTELRFTDAAMATQRSEIRTRVGNIIAKADRRALLVAPWQEDGHGDHEVLGELVRDAADGRQVLQYPIWLWHWSDPSNADLPWDGFRTFDLEPGAATAKGDAIAVFRSQLEGDDPMLRPEMIAHFTQGSEIFVQVTAQAPDEGARLGEEYFDDFHQGSDDPWQFLTRWYELRKRAVTLAALTRPRYGSALEVGSSIGVLTEQLAGRCDQLLAVDISATAVERARERLGDRARVEMRDVAVEFPPGSFDLIVLSEVGYYFRPDSLDGVLAAARDALTETGELLACHWRHPVDDYPLLGDEVHRLLATLGLARTVRHEEEDFLLEVFSRDSRSVADREGFR